MYKLVVITSLQPRLLKSDLKTVKIRLITEIFFGRCGLSKQALREATYITF